MAEVDAPALYARALPAGATATRAPQIPALSKGWQSSFQAMFQQDLSSKTAVGNPDSLTRNRYRRGQVFDRMRVADISKERGDRQFLHSEANRWEASSFVLQAGQFVVLRLHLDPDPGAGSSQLFVVRPAGSRPSPYQRHERIERSGKFISCVIVRSRAIYWMWALRGSFTLRPSQGPVVLLSAGVGATPVMSMLHALAAERSQRELWWIYGTRNRADHPLC